MTPARLQKIKAVLDTRQPDLTVVADEVHKGRNLAAIVRTCDAVGIDTIYSVRPKAGYRPYRGTALGSQKWVQVELWDAVDQIADHLAGQGFQLLTAAIGPGAVDFRSIDYTIPTALILGSERDGASEAALHVAHQKVSIPMMGMVQSLNVSVACAVILAEAQRQRSEAGCYQARRLADEQYQRRLFQWAHPQVADYCERNSLPYPGLGEDGEIRDGLEWHAAAGRL